MSQDPTQTRAEERRALLGLWSVAGIGPRSIEVIRRRVGALPAVLDEPVAKWVAGLPLTATALEGLSQVERIGPLADATLERAARAGIGIAFRGDPAYPARLAEVGDSPPLLFYVGPPCTSRRRVAMVGSRKAGEAFEEFARNFADEVARAGVGVVSGAAEGVDTACHVGCYRVGGETWAFVGSALDQLDANPAWLLPKVLETGGAFYSELPPGVRAHTYSFPRRNRLISGASDVVLLMRAAEVAGGLHTAKYAVEQGRLLLAIPGEARNTMAVGCNRLIRKGEAQACLEPKDVLSALGLGGTATVAAPVGAPVQWDEVSKEAKATYACLQREATSFEDVLAATRIQSGALASALCELELLGLVVQRPGKRYEKV